MGAAQMVDYTASKFAARGFSEALAAELKQSGQWDKCRVTSLCPAHIDTKLFKGFHLLGCMPMTPEFVAEKVVTAYECEQEIVLLPRHLALAAPAIGLMQSLCNYNVPNPRPHVSPLQNFDRKQSDDILDKIDT